MDKLMRKHAKSVKTKNTKKYDGFCYFWAYEYRHWLRDASIGERIAIHNLFLDNNLPIDERSPKHDKIVSLVLGKKVKTEKEIK